MKKIILGILVAFVANFVLAKNVGSSWMNGEYGTTEGTDFLVTFMRNSGSDETDDKDLKLYLYASSVQGAKVTVSNPNYYFSNADYYVSPGQQKMITVKNKYIYLSVPNKAGYYAVRVTSTNPITLYAACHHSSGKYEGTNVLPLKALQSTYTIQTYLADQYATEYAIIASADQNIIIRRQEITLDQDKYNNGILDTVSIVSQDEKVTLKKYQTYLYRSSSLLTSLAGTTLCSDKPFAVFQGGQNAKIPGEPDNHIFHQAYPTNQLGRIFVVTPTYNAVKDFVRITATEDSTFVYRDSVLVTMLQKGQTFQDTLVSQATYATLSDAGTHNVSWKPTVAIYNTSKVAICYLYSTGFTENGPTFEGAPVTQNAFGAPSMTPIIPQEEGLHKTIFSTFVDVPQVVKRYINIVTQTAEVKGMRLDNVDISANFHKIPTDTSYSYAIIPLTDGRAYTLSTINNMPNSTFTARIYGLGKNDNMREAYAYAAGSRTTSGVDMLIDSLYIKEKSICINQSIDFTAVLKSPYDSIRWEFGDTIISDTIVKKKQWKSPGTYMVKLIVRRPLPPCEDYLVDTVKAKITVHDKYTRVIQKKICRGTVYTYNGIDEKGKPFTQLFDKPIDTSYVYQNIYGCDSIIRLVLLVGDPTPKVYPVRACESYRWFGTTYTKSGVYTHVTTNEYGCSAIDTLKLTILKTINGPVVKDTICSGQLPIRWGTKILKKAGVYADTLRGAASNGCDSIAHLDLKVEYNYYIDTTIYICPGDTLLWRKQKLTAVNRYETHDSTPAGCDSTFILHLKHYPTYHTTSSKTICEGTNVYFIDTTLTTSGTYTRHLPTIHGCDSAFTINLTVIPTEYVSISQTICANDSVYFDGQYRKSAGDYTEYSTSNKGCTKITTLHLNVMPLTEKYDTVHICYEELPYTYANNFVAYSAGDYIAHLKYANQYNCDSTYYLHLVVNPKIVTTLPEVYQCEYDGPYSHPDSRTKHLHNLNQSGIYYDTLTAVNGCDSILTLKFIWGKRTYNTMNVRVCQSELPWKDPNKPSLNLQSDTTYVHHLTNSTHCDSVLTVNFSVAPEVTTTVDTTICSLQVPYFHPDNRLFNLQNLNNGGTYSQTIKSVDGCDSTIVLNLQIVPPPEKSMNVTICESELPYVFGANQQSVRSAGIYQDLILSTDPTKCDTLLNLNLSVIKAVYATILDTICDCNLPYNFKNPLAHRLQNLYTTGTYYDTLQSSSGCDSILMLHLLVAHAYYGLKEQITMCSNENVPWNDKILMGSWGHDTTIIDTLQTIYGCDSVIALSVHIIPAYLYDQTAEICQDKDYPQWEWIDNMGNSHGYLPIDMVGTNTYTDSFTTVNHCDSVYRIKLKVLPSYRFDTELHIGRNESAIWQNKLYAGDLSKDVGWADRVLATGTYYDTVALSTTSVCDSIYYLVLHVHQTYNRTYNVVVCEDELPYIIQSQDSYGAYVDTIALQSSDLFPMISATQKGDLTLTFTRVLKTIEHADSALHYQITVHPSYQICDNVSIEAGGFYTWRGQNYTERGVYYDSLSTSVNGCDSVYILALFAPPSRIITIDTSICMNETLFHMDTLWYSPTQYFVNPKPVWSPGESTIPLYWEIKSEGQFGRPTIYYRYKINFMPVSIYRDTIYLSTGQPYAMHDNRVIRVDDEYDQVQLGYVPIKDTLFVDTLVDAFGCDSIYSLLAHVYPKYVHTDTASVRVNQSYIWRDSIFYGIEYPNSPKPGLSIGEYTFSDTLTSTLGQDSIFQLVLRVSSTVLFQYTDTICQGEFYQFNAQRVTQTGFYYDSIPSLTGVDSIYYLYLTVSDTTVEHISDTICTSESFTLHGRKYTKTGYYKDTTTNEFGCDHYTYLSLMVVSPVEYSLDFSEICQNDDMLEIGYDNKGLSIVDYCVYFDSLGHSQGFKDIVHAPISDPANHVINIPIPYGNAIPRMDQPYFDSRVGLNRYDYAPKFTYPMPDAYPVRIVLSNGVCDDKTQMKDTILNLYYPAWIHEQHWNDAIVLYNATYNGGIEFSAYQWYYNDEPIIGQVREYLYLPSYLAMNPSGLSANSDCPNEYKVLLTRKSDGKQNFTCPICPVLQADTIVPRKDYYSVVPTLVSSANPMVWILSSVSGEYVVTTEAGAVLQSGTFTPDEKNVAGTIILPNVTGLYNVVLSSPSEKTRTCKVLVY